MTWFQTISLHSSNQTWPDLEECQLVWGQMETHNLPELYFFYSSQVPRSSQSSPGPWSSSQGLRTYYGQFGRSMGQAWKSHPAPQWIGENFCYLHIITTFRHFCQVNFINFPLTKSTSAKSFRKLDPSRLYFSLSKAIVSSFFPYFYLQFSEFTIKKLLRIQRHIHQSQNKHLSRFE